VAARGTDGLGPTGVPGSAPCSDARTAAQATNPNTPWCRPGRAVSTNYEWLSGGTADGTIPGPNGTTWGGNLALGPGDTIYIRRGTYTDVYCPTGTGTFCSILEGSSLDKGTAAAPVTISAYPGDERLVVFDPGGKLPEDMYWGITFREESDGNVCWGGTNDGTACASHATCTGGGRCDNTGWYWIINGIKFTNWDYVYGYNNPSYPALTAPRNNPFVVPPGCPNGCPGYAGSHSAILSAQQDGPHGMVTIQNCEFTDNEGGGVLNLRSAFGWTIQDNIIHDNWTKGWTSPVNIIDSHGWPQKQPNVIRRNRIWNNRDTPPVWCLDGTETGSFPRDGSYCTDPDGDTNPADDNECNDMVNGGGYLCPCRFNKDCQSGSCINNPTPWGNCDNDLGVDEGDTEGNGIIIDRAQGLCVNDERIVCGWPADPACSGLGGCQMGNAGFTVIENNVIYDNWGFGVNAFMSGQTTVRNNTLYHNGKRFKNDYVAEISFWGRNNVATNNITIPRPEGQCTCTSDAQCGTGTCDLLLRGRVCRNKEKSTCTSNADCPSGTCQFKLAWSAEFSGAGLGQPASGQYYSANDIGTEVAGTSNLLRQGTGGAMSYYNPTTLEQLAVSIGANWAGNSTSLPFTRTAPNFIGPVSGSTVNFQPALGSGVLGVGDPATFTGQVGFTALARALTDWLGITRSATTPSLGAYELASGQTTTTTTTTTTTPTSSTTTTTAGSTTTTSTTLGSTTTTTTTTVPGIVSKVGGVTIGGARF
jgi:parallel beta-helix repeat protein